ncbi:LysR family transcriptional regulator [Chondromyces crocatus]|uniref:LysR family transcriptional regulator n=1 Tax=Chondromyces crocatus TaxID=52 RepID=A0A0K1EQ36_CHOCO|nr:LysR family transcriptional regulator [Chondromyces crocatus]AKT42961.1 LysR family transcriptional regulator [Chondromyces crocatus]
MRPDWDDLRVFLAVARAGNLSAAARAIGQTQPTLGRRLRALEEVVGTRLFQRSAEGFVLTDEGARILAHVERMEAEALSVDRALAGQEAELSGLVRVSTSEWFGSHVVAPIFARFTQRHPRVTIEIVAETRLLSLARREADLVFRFRRFEESDVVERKATHVAFGVYATSAYLKRAGTPTRGEGEGHALITMNEAFAGLADVTWLRRMLPAAHIAGRSNSRDVQAALCEAGGGIAVLPRTLGDGRRSLRRLDLGEPPPGRDIWAGYHADMRRSPKLRALLDFLGAELAAMAEQLAPTDGP